MCRVLVAAKISIFCLIVAGWSASIRSPFNDNFSDRLPVIPDGLPIISDIQGATVENGEPSHASGQIGKSIWFEFTPNTSGSANISTFGNAQLQEAYSPISTNAPYFAVYTGETMETLREVSSSNGLIFNNSGYFSGYSVNVPVTAGTKYKIAIAADRLSYNAPGASILSVNAAPTITSSARAFTTQGKAFAFTVTASNNPQTYSAIGLPDGLSLNPVTGVISGTSTSTGTFSVALTASNAFGVGNATLTLVINPAEVATPLPPVWIYEPASMKAYIGQSVSESYWAYNLPTSFSVSNLPPGLSLSTGSGSLNGVATISAQISGQPTTSGIYYVPITATNAQGSANMTVTFVIPATVQPPVITSNSVAAGSLGSPFFYSISTQHDATAPFSTKTYTASNLPPGLSVSTSTGQISGTPTATGVFSVPVSATTSGVTSTAIVTITISEAIPASTLLYFTSSATSLGTVGRSFTYTLTANGSPSNITCGSLPPGLTFNSTTRVISGTPSTAGVYFVPVSATSGSQSVDATLSFKIQSTSSLMVSQPPVISSPASALCILGRSMSYNTTVESYSSGYTYTATGLPPGLSIGSATGRITGTPTTLGEFNAEIRAVNSSGTANATVKFFVVSSATATPVISSPASARYPSFSAYTFDSTPPTFSYNITSSNGPTSFGASNLPSGLSVNPYTGEISGIPQSAGVFRVPISATNAAGVGNATLTIVSNILPPQITSSPNVLGTVGSSLNYTVTTNLNSWSQTAGLLHARPLFTADGLPPGLSINRSTGVISGEPKVAGISSAKITCSNLGGDCDALLKFVISPQSPPIVSPPVFTSGAASAQGAVGLSMDYSLWAINEPASFAATGLPPGLDLTVSNGTYNGISTKYAKISGIPTVAGTFSVPVTVSNASGSASVTLTFAIAAAPQPPLIISDATNQGAVGSQFFYSVTNAYDALIWNKPKTFSAIGLPPGLSINTTSGQISGIPTAAGTFTTSISATIAGQTGTALVTFEIAPSYTFTKNPDISGPAGDLGFVGVPFAYSISAVGSSSIDATSLPGGLVWSVGNGTSNNVPSKWGYISGTPTTSGEFIVPVTATNSVGSSTAFVTIKIVVPQGATPIVMSNPANVTATAGEPASFAATASGVPPPTFQWDFNGAPIPGATDSSLQLPETSLSNAGSYGVLVSNAYGSEQSVAALVVNQTFENWRKSVFTPGEIIGNATKPESDFNQDGSPNLVDYALGKDPKTGLGGSLTIYVPAGGRSLQIEFQRDARKTDVSYIVEASSNLQTWTPIAQSLHGGGVANLGGASDVIETGTGIVSVTVRDAASLDGNPRRFLRLKVTRP